MAVNEPVHLQEDETGDRFLIYTDGTGAHAEVAYQGKRLWMTQAQIATLYGRNVSTISRHIANILEEGELDESNLQKMQIASSTKPITLYSLDMVISVGYRVASKQATLFRRWATDKLVQFATKGFVIDAPRLKNPEYRDRIAELKEIIRDIRSDEANVIANCERSARCARTTMVSPKHGRSSTVRPRPSSSTRCVPKRLRRSSGAALMTKARIWACALGRTKTSAKAM